MKITLTDVMRGIHNLTLYNKLPASQFRFLIGLICKANSLGFKKTMELNNSDAMGLGGGNSRQTVNQLRQGLSEFRIDGQPILEVEHGSYYKNISAKYRINYALLTQNGSPWKDEGGSSPSSDASKNLDGDGTVVLTDVLTTPRSDQKREEEINPPTPPNEVTTSEGQENENAGAGGGIIPEDSEEDWITYLVGILCKPKEKFPPIDILEKATWLVKHNDLELIEECYDEFQAIPIVKIRNSTALFMSMVEKRGGEVIR